MAEQNSDSPSKLLRVSAITLMAIAVVITLLAGAGSTCVAFGAENYDSMAALVPYKALYQVFVVLSLAVGLWGIPVTLSLVRGSTVAYRNALLVLLLGGTLGGLQMGVSQSVRGASAPVNMRFFVTLFVLSVFLLLRLPPLWRRVDFGQPLKGGSGGASAGTALIVSAAVTLTTPLWAGPTHMPSGGENWVAVLQTPLMVGGAMMLLAGAVLLLAALTRAHRARTRLALAGRRA
jgi:hypothetical protein